MKKGSEGAQRKEKMKKERQIKFPPTSHYCIALYWTVRWNVPNSLPLLPTIPAGWSNRSLSPRKDVEILAVQSRAPVDGRLGLGSGLGLESVSVLGLGSVSGLGVVSRSKSGSGSEGRGKGERGMSEVKKCRDQGWGQDYGRRDNV